MKNHIKIGFFVAVLVSILFVAGSLWFAQPLRISASSENYSLKLGNVEKASSKAIPVVLTIEKPEDEILQFNYEGIRPIDDDIMDGVEGGYDDGQAFIETFGEKKQSNLHLSKSDKKFILKFEVFPLEDSKSFTIALSKKGKEISKISYDLSDKLADKSENKKKIDLDLLEKRGIQSLAENTSRAVNPVSVNSWSTFVEALQDSSVDQIDITEDITANAATGNPITRSLVINGNGHTLTFDATSNRVIQLGEISSEKVVVVNNLNLTGSNVSSRMAYFSSYVADVSRSQNWSLLFNQVNVLSGNRMALAYVPAGKVQINGTVDLISTGTQPLISSKELLITDNSQVTGTIANKFFNATEAGANVMINKRSQVNLDIQSQNAFSLNATGSLTIQGDEELKTREGNTKVILTTNSNGTGDDGGLFNFDTGQYGPPVHFNVKDYATVSAKSLHARDATPVVMIQSKGASFNVDNHSFMELYGDGESNTRGATMRFRFSGDSSFNLSNNSTMKITKTQQRQAAIRMNGGGNSVNVKSGSKFFVTNIGDGTARNGGTGVSETSAYNYNQGISYLNADVTSPNDAFTLTGEGSLVKIHADSGPAIDAARGVDVVAEKGTFFEAIGKTSGAAIFRSGSGALNFNMTEPMYYDFRNNATNGGDLMIGDVASSSFVSGNSDVSFWKKGMNLDDAPYYDRTLVSYSLSQANMLLDTYPDADFQTKFGANASVNQYSRMSANNSSPVIDDLRVPTNADKYIYGHAKVFEGYDDNGNRMERDAWGNEVQVVVDVKYPDGTTETLQGTTYDGPDAIYDDANQEGYFKIPVGKFIPTGTTITIKEAWRGPVDATEEHRHSSAPSDIVVTSVTALDVTPPTQAVITTEINNAAKQIKGTSDENGAKVFVKINGEWLRDSTGNALTTTVSSGNWTIDLPKYIEKTAQVEVYLKDTTEISPLPSYVLPRTYTQEPDGIFGNLNEAVTIYDSYTGYHDAVKATEDERFEPSTLATVADVIPDAPNLVKEVVSSGGNTTSVGDILTYTLYVSNTKADSYDWTNVRITDELVEGLKFDPAKHKVTIDNVEVGTDKYSYDEATRTMKIQVGDLSKPTVKSETDSTLVYKEVKVTFQVTVEQSAVDKDLENIATATGDSPQEDPFEIGAINPNATHKPISITSNKVGLPGGPAFGILSFVSAPTALDFGIKTESLNGNTVALNPNIIGEPLVVSDNRGNLQRWTMTATLLSPLSNGNAVFPDAVHYVNGESDEIITGSAKPIFTHTNEEVGDYNISEEEWVKKDNGFKIELAPGSVNKLGKYQATIQFSLEDTP